MTPSSDLRAALEKCRGAKILVLGDLMLDEYIWGNVNRVSPEAPVQILEWTSHHDGLGGAANVAQNLRALGCEVYLMGVVGDDDKAERLLQLLREINVNHDDIVTDSQRPTTTKLRVMAQNQQILRIDRERSQQISKEIEEQLAEALKARIPEVDGIVCSDYNKGLLTRTLLATSRRLASQASKLIVVDPKGVDYTRYLDFDMITPNRKELEAATQLPTQSDSEIVKAGQRILSQTHGDGLLVTRGPDGMTLLQADREPIHIATTAREVYDVTGAGDTVLSVFAMARFRDVNNELAARLANLAAGLEVAKIGATAVSYEEVLSAIEDDITNTTAKILQREQAKTVASRARGQGKRVVFTNGCYDILHVGHIKLLKQARALGDLLIVGINDDDSVRRLKGKNRPLIAQQERAQVLAALDCVDHVILFPEETPLALIETLRPHVLVKGGDYALHEVVGRDEVESYGGRVELVPIVPGFSTSDLVKSIIEKYHEQ